MNESDWSRLEGLLGEQPMPPLVTLRQQFPGLSFMCCDAQDLADASAFRSYKTADVFLVDGRHHCLCITQGLDCATGIVVAARPPV